MRFGSAVRKLVGVASPLFNRCNLVPMQPSGQNQDEILHQADRILASPIFAGSERMSRFLRYLVAESAAGRGEHLKEYTIAQEVFQRPSSFDPRADSTVRSEASKLRAKLQLYYQAEGSGDPILITIPKGGYVTVFERRAEQPTRAVPVRRSYKWFAILSLAALAGGATLWWRLKPTLTSNESSGTVVRLTSDAGLTAFPALSSEGRL